MKKLLLSCVICFISFGVFAQSDAQKMEAAKDLINKQQYASAFNMLNSCAVYTPELVINFSSLLMEHNWSVSNNYNTWTFKDMPGGERVVYNLYLENFLFEAIKKWPAECRLYDELCKFYAFILKAKGRYIPIETTAAMGAQVEKIVQPKCPGYLSNYILGVASTEAGSNAKAIEQLKRSIALNPGFYESSLQLSRAYFQKADYTNALLNSKKAYDLALKDYERSNAVLISAQCYEATNDNINALKSYSLADSLQRKNFFVLKSLLNFYVKTNNDKAPATLKTFIGSQGRTDLFFYTDAYEIYAAHNRLADLALFCKNGLTDYKGRVDIERCLNFTLGKIYQKTNPDMAKQYLSLAKSQGIKAEDYLELKNHPNTKKMIIEAFKTI